MNRTFFLAASPVFSLAGQIALAGGPNAAVSGSTLFPKLGNADVIVRVGAEQ